MGEGDFGCLQNFSCSLFSSGNWLSLLKIRQLSCDRFAQQARESFSCRIFVVDHTTGRYIHWCWELAIKSHFHVHLRFHPDFFNIKISKIILRSKWQSFFFMTGEKEKSSNEIGKIGLKVEYTWFSYWLNLNLEISLNLDVSNILQSQYFGNVSHKSADLDTFLKVMKSTNHTEMWDAEQLACYSPSATSQICFYGLENGLGIHAFRSTSNWLIVKVLATWAKFL